jgi:predicted O-methyltransferase YrrM
MTPEEVSAIVGDTPCMSLDEAKRMRKFVQRHRPSDVLELGFAHGVSSCYMAAALDEIGGGRITTIDLESSRKREPNIHDLLDQCGFSDSVTVHFEPRSFTWRLMRMLEQPSPPMFDLVYLDGGHSWDVTGFGFFLVDKLLRDGGWLIFDDIDWTYAESPTLGDKPIVQEMPEDYRETPQVRKVFELLVKQHPGYTRCSIKRSWGYAQKRRRRSLWDRLTRREEEQPSDS